eukprot:5685509-Lingulodinium_polyedra.AAC.1
MTAAGIVLSTDFSGEGCAETAWRIMEYELKAAGMIAPTTPAMQHYRACDNDKLCQRVLNSNHRPCHLFSDVMERMPFPARKHVDSLRPQIKAGKRGSLENMERAA